MTKDEAKKVIDQVLSLSTAPDCQVSMISRHSSYTRYANNEITTSGAARDLTLSVTSAIERKTGRATVNEVSMEALQRVVTRSGELARIAPPDPEYMEPLEPQNYPEVQAFFERTAAARAQDRLPGVRAVIEGAAFKRLFSSGYFANNASVSAMGNKRGNFGYHRATNASYSATVRTEDGTGSGWAEDASPRIEEVNARRIADTAIRKALESRNPQRLEPGDYTVILEPDAVADLLGGLFSSFSARVAVEKGVVKNLFYDRYWASKMGKNPTPGPSNIILEGGTASLEDLIKSTERGLLVTHFWYIRTVNPQNVQLTGLTRDGLFLIENGKIKHPVMNFRFNESPVVMLKNAEMMTPAVRAGSMIVPAIKARNFTFSSVSDAV